jgi:hypothetical protein
MDSFNRTTNKVIQQITRIPDSFPLAQCLKYPKPSTTCEGSSDEAKAFSAVIPTDASSGIVQRVNGALMDATPVLVPNNRVVDFDAVLLTSDAGVSSHNKSIHKRNKRKIYQNSTVCSGKYQL